MVQQVGVRHAGPLALAHLPAELQQQAPSCPLCIDGKGAGGLQLLKCFFCAPPARGSSPPHTWVGNVLPTQPSAHACQVSSSGKSGFPIIPTPCLSNLGPSQTPTFVALRASPLEGGMPFADSGKMLLHCPLQDASCRRLPWDGSHCSHCPFAPWRTAQKSIWHPLWAWRGPQFAPVRRLGPWLLRVRALQSLRKGCEATSRVCRGGWWSNRAVRLP